MALSMRPRRPFSGAAAVLSLLSLVVPLAASAVDAPIADDAYTDFANPATNYGASRHLMVEPALTYGYVRFDLSTLPAGTLGSDVARANLKVWVKTLTGSGEFLVGAVLDPWDEPTITGAAPPTIAATVTSPTVDEAASFVVVNVTPFVQDWLDGVIDNNGFMIQIPVNVPLTMRLDSKENRSTAHEPELDIILN